MSIGNRQAYAKSLEEVTRQLNGYSFDLQMAYRPCVLSGYYDIDKVSYLKGLIEEAEARKARLEKNIQRLDAGTAI